MIARPILLSALALVSHMHAVTVADTAVPVSAPAEFRTLVTRATMPVVVSQSSSEVFNSVDKGAIESQCEVARQTGLTDKHPVFEACHGEPVKTESLRLGNATQWALLSALRACERVRPEGRPTEANGVCDRTNHIKPHHRAEIRNMLATGAQTLTADLTTATAAQRVAASRPGDDQEPLPLVPRRQKVVLNVAVDAGVFKLPEGIAVKEAP